MEREEIPKRRLGKTNFEATILGLGGEGVLRTYGRGKEADELINAALDAGINYFETARAYSESEAYLGASLKERRQRIFLASKSHARDKKGAQAHLNETLQNLRTDYLDLWMVHDMRTEEEIGQVFGKGGAIEAFIEAREKGYVKYIGVSGHEDPVIIRKCIEAFDFDTALIPVNPAEPFHKCFLEEIVPLASSRDIGLIGMKTYIRGRLNAPKKLLFSYSLSQSITLAAIGCDDVEQLNENVEAAKNYMPLKYKEVQRLTGLIAPYARDLLYYKP